MIRLSIPSSKNIRNVIKIYCILKTNLKYLSQFLREVTVINSTQNSCQYQTPTTFLLTNNYYNK